MVYISRSPEERFWEKVNKDGPVLDQSLGQCWEWTAATDKDGYGRFNLISKIKPSEPAYRVAFEWANGPIGNGLQPDHRCKNKACVRPSHLEAVTVRVNAQRSGKLIPVQVLEIRKRLEAGETRTALAKAFGVTYMTIKNIERRVSWSDLQGAD